MQHIIPNGDISNVHFLGRGAAIACPHPTRTGFSRQVHLLLDSLNGCRQLRIAGLC